MSSTYSEIEIIKNNIVTTGLKVEHNRSRLKNLETEFHKNDKTLALISDNMDRVISQQECFKKRLVNLEDDKKKRDILKSIFRPLMDRWFVIPFILIIFSIIGIHDTLYSDSLKSIMLNLMSYL